MLSKEKFTVELPDVENGKRPYYYISSSSLKIFVNDNYGFWHYHILSYFSNAAVIIILEEMGYTVSDIVYKNNRTILTVIHE